MSNLDDLINKYNNLINNKIEDTIKDTLNDTGKFAVNEIKKRSTVDTGKMRDSMDYTPPTKEGDNEWYIEVGNWKTPYCIYQEFGFFNVWARRFIPGVFMVREGAKQGREFLHEELQKRMDVLFKND